MQILLELLLEVAAGVINEPEKLVVWLLFSQL